MDPVKSPRGAKPACAAGNKKSRQNAETLDGFGLYNGMAHYRFVTPSRSGKWYPSIEAAQKAAARIGAGFWDELGRIFYPYRFTRLETRLL